MQDLLAGTFEHPAAHVLALVNIITNDVLDIVGQGLHDPLAAFFQIIHLPEQQGVFRVRLGRAMQKPPMRQEDLAREINLMGMEITPLIISRIEKNQRHVCDAELLMLSRALRVTMEWLCGVED